MLKNKKMFKNDFSQHNARCLKVIKSKTVKAVLNSFCVHNQLLQLKLKKTSPYKYSLEKYQTRWLAHFEYIKVKIEKKKLM